MRDHVFGAAIIAGAALVAAACSSSTAPSPDASGAQDAASDAPSMQTVDAVANDATESDGGLDDSQTACAATIPAFCETDGGCSGTCPCLVDWTAARMNARMYCTGGGWDRVYLYDHCDGFNLLVVGYTDTSTFFYYDPSTLALVRVEDHGAGGSLCAAGTPGTVAPLTDCFDGAVPPASLCDVDTGAD